MKMEQSVPKRRHIKFRRRGINQKKAYNKVFDINDARCNHEFHIYIYIYIYTGREYEVGLQNYYFSSAELTCKIILCRYKYHLTNLQAPIILYAGQAFRYSPEDTFYVFNQQIYFII
jgi:hypothetical protein